MKRLWLGVCVLCAYVRAMRSHYVLQPLHLSRCYALSAGASFTRGKLQDTHVR
jgi:hypothetical protein